MRIKLSDSGDSISLSSNEPGQSVSKPIGVIAIPNKTYIMVIKTNFNQHFFWKNHINPITQTTNRVHQQYGIMKKVFN